MIHFKKKIFLEISEFPIRNAASYPWNPSDSRKSARRKPEKILPYSMLPRLRLFLSNSVSFFERFSLMGNSLFFRCKSAFIFL